MAPTTGAAPATSSLPGRMRGRTARSRAMIYSILAQAFSLPSDSLCSAVEDGSFPALVRYALAGTSASHRRMIESGFLEKLTAANDSGRFSESILIEYTRLFGLNLHCPQYEADYLARNSDSAVHVIAGVVNMYSLFGVKLADGVGERPDHIAVELDFLNFLAAKEAHASDKGQTANAKLCRRAQARFFEDHLSRWASAFARNLGEAAYLSFYHGVRELLEAFLLAEATYLKVEMRTSALEQRSDDSSQACGQCTDVSQEQPNGLINITGLVKEVAINGNRSFLD